MSRKIVYLLCLLFCLGACNDDRLSDSNAAAPPSSGEAVPVNLVLDVAPLSPPLSAITRTGTNASGLQASFSGMEVELSGQPVATTRAFPALNDSIIHSVVILQFEGTAPNSSCCKAQYIEASGGNLDLSNFTFSATQSPISRIAVIANVSSTYFDLSAWESGKTYEDLMNEHLKKKDFEATYPLYKVPQDANNRALMFGVTDTKIETGKLVTVVLQRIFTKCSFNIDVADALKTKYPIWQAQLANLPGRCYLIPAGRGEPFPGIALLGDDGYYNGSTVTTANGVFNADALDAYIPVNIQSDVPTATEQTRTLMAPTGSTYLQIVGLKLTQEGSIQDQVIYQIYLGSNFTTNYTISPNTFYNYTIRIKDDNPQDGTIVKFIPGYWGGKLQAYDANSAAVSFGDVRAVKWRYEKEIEFYPFDVRKVGIATPTYTMFWGPKGTLQPQSSLTDGRKNTWNIQGASGNDQYEASYACYHLNSTVTSENDLKWYQPSISQLVGTYLVCANLLSTLSAGYWSSTEYDANHAYYITKYGEIAYGVKAYGYYVRAAKDLN